MMNMAEAHERLRTSRRMRAKGRDAKLRDRDVDILHALAKMRLLKTSDITRLFFRATGTAQKRLRKLYDTGLVKAVVTDLASENRYALTPVGHALLEQALPEGSVPAYRPAPRIDGRSVAHLDLLNRYRIAVAMAATAAGVELVRFTPEWELRAAEPKADLIPDAVAVLRSIGRQLPMAIEIDVGTESPRTVARKIERYASLALRRFPVFGLPSPKVIVVTTTPRRARSLARSMAVDAPVLMGAAPFLLEDGGLRRGFALVNDLRKAEGAIGAEIFSKGLLALRTG